MGVGWPSPGGMIPGMQSLLCLPTWGGKGGLLLDSLGMAWGWAAWGSRHTDCRDSRLALDPSEALEELTRLKDWGRAMFPWTLLASLAPDPHPMAPDPHSLESPPSPQVQG